MSGPTGIGATPIATVAAPACPACGGSGPPLYSGLPDRLYLTPGLWSFRCCSNCGSLWLDPRPTDDDLGSCYPPFYFTHSDGPDPEELAPRLSGFKGLLRRHVLAATRGYRFPQGPPRPTLLGSLLALVPPVRDRATHGLGPLLPSWKPGGRLLDVGCGNGAYLALLRAYGWEVLGQEIDQLAAERARRLYGLEVTTEPLGELAKRDPGFDVVTASHVIEHVPQPVQFLRDMAACLRPGGQVVVVTPNAGALGRRLFRESWYALQPPQHLFLFSHMGLAHAAEQAQLAEVRVRSLARKAARWTRRALAMRRTGRFDHSAQLDTLQVAASLLATLERGLALIAPVGEELVLVAQRPCQ